MTNALPAFMSQFPIKKEPWSFGEGDGVGEEGMNGGGSRNRRMWPVAEWEQDVFETAAAAEYYQHHHAYPLNVPNIPGRTLYCLCH